MAARRRHLTICLEGWIYLGMLGFVLAAALLREINLLVLLFGLMLGPFLCNYWLARRTLQGLEIRRRAPDSICAGDLLVVEFEAANRRRWLGSWAVTIEDQITVEAGPGRLPRTRPQALFTHVPARQSRMCGYRGRLLWRGRYRFGPLRYWTRFPFGLLRNQFTTDDHEELLVYPKLGRLTHHWERLRRNAEVGSEQVKSRQGLVEGDFYGLRDWRTGDSRRWIHWRTSARRGGLVVRQFERHRSQDAAVLVDLWRPETPTPEDDEHVELAVRFAATVVDDLCRGGGRTLFVGVAGEPVRFLGGPASWAMMQEAMQWLAVAAASTVDHLPELLGRALDEVRPETNIWLISTRDLPRGDLEQYASIASHPRRRALLGRIQCVQSRPESLAEVFEP